MPGRPADGPVAAIERFFADALRVAESAHEAAGRIEHRYRLGPAAFRLVCAGEAVASAIAPTLAHIRLPEDGAAEIAIHAWSEATAPLPPAPWPAEAYGQRGGIDLGDGRFSAFYQLGADSVSVLDRQRGVALYHLRRPLPYWERSFPFRPIFHAWLADTGLQPVHAGAVGRPDGGVIVTGPSGSGKTTTTIACLAGGLSYAGDDYVLVGTAPRPVVYSLYCAAKFTDDALRRFPELAQHVWNPERAPGEKALVYGCRGFPDALVPEMPIRAVVLPRVTGLVDSSVRRVTAAAAIRALAPTTLAHLPGHAASTLAKLTRLCMSVPCFELAAGTDLRQLPLAILQILDGVPSR